MDAVECLRGQQADFESIDMRHDEGVPFDRELRRISESELRTLAEDAGDHAAKSLLSTILAAIDVDIENPEEMRKLRGGMIFLFGLQRTAETAKTRFWMTFLTILSGALILAVAQAMWNLFKSKIN